MFKRIKHVLGCRMTSVILLFHASYVVNDRWMYCWVVLAVLAGHYVISTHWMWKTKSNRGNMFMAGFAWLIEPLVNVQSSAITFKTALHFSLLYTSQIVAFTIFWFIEDTTFNHKMKTTIIVSIVLTDTLTRILFSFYIKYELQFFAMINDRKRKKTRAGKFFMYLFKFYPQEKYFENLKLSFHF